MIAIEVKFLESSSDPSKELGIDWSGTLGSTGTFRQASSLKWDDEKQVWSWDETLLPNKEGGFRFDAAEMSVLSELEQDRGNAQAGLHLPFWAAKDLSVRLRALVNNQDTKMVSYPRMVTLNNREVVIRSVVNQPVLDGSSAISSGGGAATSQSITYLPIGTVLNILPKKMEEAACC